MTYARLALTLWKPNASREFIRKTVKARLSTYKPLLPESNKGTTEVYIKLFKLGLMCA